jgi:hypothetical protein
MIHEDLDLTLKRMDAKDGITVAVFIHRKSHFTKYLHKLRRAGGRSAAVGDSGAPSPATDNEMDYDDILMQNIDEQTLRRIFHGLCGD